MVPKFRAWDKENDRMIYPSTEGVCFELDDDGINILDVSGDYPEDHTFPAIDSVLMQSTGLKDKNGVEIFEGDLVKVSVDNGFDYLFEELSIVKPSKFHSGLVCSLKSHEAEYRIIHAEILGYEYEVVGNIYENPELLEQANA
ncbi:YopX family protein [Enterococcus gallinarum]|uniref:YopX family protein n=1 Tax=Enterococcus gallinarum TaxID=1353 RepID=UPI00391D2FFE